MRVIEGKLEPGERTFCVIVARYNAFITTKLLDGAVRAFEQHGVTGDALTVVHVPGGFELPLAAKRAAASGDYAAVICLGAVVRGDTPHFDYVCAEAARGIGQAARDTGVPVVFGVLTVDTVEQAIERAGPTPDNKGFEAAECALEMADLLGKL